VVEAVQAGGRDNHLVTVPSDPMAMLRSRSYLMLLGLAAVIGVPVSAVAYGFLALVSYLQQEIFTHLPHGLGSGMPAGDSELFEGRRPVFHTFRLMKRAPSARWNGVLTAERLWGLT
jgi:hypothetical protein